MTDYYIYIGKETKKWDTCPGEVFVNAFDGILTGLDGKTYDY